MAKAPTTLAVGPHNGQFWNTAEVGMARFTAMRAMRMLRIRLIILCLWIATKNATH